MGVYTLRGQLFQAVRGRPGIGISRDRGVAVQRTRLRGFVDESFEYIHYNQSMDIFSAASEVSIDTVRDSPLT